MYSLVLDLPFKSCEFHAPFGEVSTTPLYNVTKDSTQLGHHSEVLLGVFLCHFVISQQGRIQVWLRGGGEF